MNCCVVPARAWAAVVVVNRVCAGVCPLVIRVSERVKRFPMSVNDVVVSADEVAVFQGMRPSVVFSLDDAAHEEFMRIVEGDVSAPDERLARLWARESPFGRHVDV